MYNEKPITIKNKALNIYSIITDKQLPDGLLTNAIWKQADFYHFCSDSQYWGCAHLNKLPKTSSADPAAALLYLLQGEREALKYPTDRKLPSTVKDFFEQAIAEGQFTNPEGKLTDTATCWKNYKETINGIGEEPTFQFLKNGKQVALVELLNAEELVNVTAYADEWNDRQYFIETTNAWVLFGWATMA